MSAEVRNTLAVPFSIGRCSCVDIKQSTWTTPWLLVSFFRRVVRYPSRSNLQRNVECHVRSCSESRERASCFQLHTQSKKSLSFFKIVLHMEFNANTEGLVLYGKLYGLNVCVDGRY